MFKHHRKNITDNTIEFTTAQFRQPGEMFVSASERLHWKFRMQHTFNILFKLTRTNGK